jgi:exodeoxyribonuclease VII large subunit
MFEQEQPLTLRGLNRMIGAAIRQQFGFRKFWVQAEVTQFKVSRGHCYLQLIEKEEISETICAEARGMIWATTAGPLLARFEREAGTPLRDQLQILCLVEITFHERYGLSLSIHDIDPAFTMGRLEQQRRKNIELLKKEGIYELNRQIDLPAVIQNIAVISSADAKGYEDFMQRLHSHQRQYRFHVDLYTALVQGTQAPADIIRCLLQIENAGVYDAVIIVRGGGSIVDLECFNDYQLARQVALCAIPVITGIGHTTNRSICDEVAAVDCITPTDAAFFLLQKMEAFEDALLSLFGEILQTASSVIEYEQNTLQQYSYSLISLSKGLQQQAGEDLKDQSFRLRQSAGAILSGAGEWLQSRRMEIYHVSRSRCRELRHELEMITGSLKTAALRITAGEESELKICENRVRLTDPQLLLLRGYSYTLYNGKAVTSAAQVKSGDMITTVLKNGRLKSIVSDGK